MPRVFASVTLRDRKTNRPGGEYHQHAIPAGCDGRRVARGIQRIDQIDRCRHLRTVLLQENVRGEQDRPFGRPHLAWSRLLPIVTHSAQARHGAPTLVGQNHRTLRPLVLYQVNARHSTTLKGVQTMRKTITTLLLLATLAGTAHAQVRKCILPDGKVTYSDVLCSKDVAMQADVNLVANSADKSPARAEARRFAVERLITLARNREPNRCKFSIEPSIRGDGRQLAEDATHECFANIVAEQTGHPIRNDAFERWFENQQLAEGKRSASDKQGSDRSS